jgi:hypothetical protein
MATLEKVGDIMRRMFSDSQAERYIIVRSNGAVTLLDHYETGAIPIKYTHKSSQKRSEFLD